MGSKLFDADGNIQMACVIYRMSATCAHWSFLDHHWIRHVRFPHVKKKCESCRIHVCFSDVHCCFVLHVSFFQIDVFGECACVSERYLIYIYMYMSVYMYIYPV